MGCKGTPYSLLRHPTPYTLHSAPYTLPPTPYTLHPAPSPIHSTPYLLHPTHCSVILNHVPYTLIPTPSTLYPQPSSVNPNKPLAPTLLNPDPLSLKHQPQTTNPHPYARSFTSLRPSFKTPNRLHATLNTMTPTPQTLQVYLALRNTPLVGPYSSPLQRDLWLAYGAGCFF